MFKILPLFVLLFFTLVAESLHIELSAEKAVLINADSGVILFEKEGFTPAYPASTSKIATALYALHVMGDKLDQVITVKREALLSITPQAKKDSNYRSPPHLLESDSTHIGLRAGEELTFEQLLHGLLVSSANDCANVIAMSIEGNVAAFMEKVNDYLLSIGCKMTFLNNPHGLHHPAHMTTAYDLALMAKVGLKNPIFSEIVKKSSFVCPETNLEEERLLMQTNLLLRKGAFHYPKAIGVKTGSTQAAGKNLVAAACDKGRVLIAVVMGCKTRAEVYQDISKLFTTAFSEPKMRRTLFAAGDRSLSCKVKGVRAKLQTEIPEGLSYDFYPAEDEPYKVVLRWDLPPLPIKKGSVVGYVSVVNERGETLKQSQVVAASDAARHFWPYLAAAGLIVLLGILLIKLWEA